MQSPSTFFTPSTFVAQTSFHTIGEDHGKIQTFTPTDSDRIKSLALLVSIPRAQRLPSRKSRPADNAWDLYQSLSSASKRNLHPSLYRRILRSVVPPLEHVRDITDTRTRDSRLRYPHAQVEQWEIRLRTIIADMASSSSSSSEIVPDTKDYIFVMEHLAQVGDLRSCEAVASELSDVGKLDVRVYELRTIVLAKWFDTPLRHGKRQSDVETFTHVLRQLLSDLDAGHIPYRRLTLDLLLAATVQALHVSDERLSIPLKDLFEEILVKGYGVDLRYFSVYPTDETASMSHKSIHAVVDYMGIKGDAFGMVAAFEAFASPLYSADDSLLRPGIEAGSDPTKGEAIANAPTAEHLTLPFPSISAPIPQHRRSFTDYLTTIPNPPALYEKLCTKFLDHDMPADDADSSLVTVSTPAYSETFLIMLRHACRIGEVGLALHILDSALRTSQQVRADWLSELIGLVRNARSAVPPISGNVHDTPHEKATERLSSAQTISTPNGIGIGVRLLMEASRQFRLLRSSMPSAWLAKAQAAMECEHEEVIVLSRLRKDISYRQDLNRLLSENRGRSSRASTSANFTTVQRTQADSALRAIDTRLKIVDRAHTTLDNIMSDIKTRSASRTASRLRYRKRRAIRRVESAQLAILPMLKIAQADYEQGVTTTTRASSSSSIEAHATLRDGDLGFV
jgi:hypothetical protein